MMAPRGSQRFLGSKVASSNTPHDRKFVVPAPIVARSFLYTPAMASRSGSIVLVTKSLTFVSLNRMSPSFSDVGIQAVPPGSDVMKCGNLPPMRAITWLAVAWMEMASR